MDDEYFSSHPFLLLLLMHVQIFFFENQSEVRIGIRYHRHDPLVVQFLIPLTGNFAGDEWTVVREYHLIPLFETFKRTCWLQGFPALSTHHVSHDTAYWPISRSILIPYHPLKMCWQPMWGRFLSVICKTRLLPTTDIICKVPQHVFLYMDISSRLWLKVERECKLRPKSPLSLDVVGIQWVFWLFFV